jgi:hypothetical protein
MLCRSSIFEDCSSKDLQFILQLNLAKAGDATGSVGRSHSSEEVSVMEMERRASVIQSELFLNNTDD